MAFRPFRTNSKGVLLVVHHKQSFVVHRRVVIRTFYIVSKQSWNVV